MDAPQAYGPDRLRRRMLIAAGLLTVFGLLHHADHVVRGEIVDADGLDPAWNHSGWPFQDAVSPFTASLLIYVLLGVGIVLTLRRRVLGGYWLPATLVLAAIIIWVHFVPGPETETPRVIAESHRSALAAVLALADVAAILATMAVLLALSVQALRSQRPRAGRPAAG